MAMDLGPRQDLPQHTTFAGFQLDRLGLTQTVRADYAETCDALLRGPVSHMLGELEAYTGVAVDAFKGVPTLVGAEVTRTDTSAVVGTVSTHDATSGAVEFTVAPTEDLSGIEVCVWGRNDFGVPAQRQARYGETWQSHWHSNIPEHRARLVQIQVEIFVEAVTAGLGALGVTKTEAEVLAAVQGLLASGVNVESMIASAFERLEQDRQAGVVYAPTTGVPPQ